MSLFNIGKIPTKAETLTGARTITPEELRANDVFAFDPGGADRDVTLPAESDDLDGHAFFVENTADAAAEFITLKNDGADTICVLAQNEAAVVYYRDSPSGAWKAVKSLRTSPVAGASQAAVAAPTAYTAHAAGGVAVTSNAATDLDTTAAALATLVTEVTSLRTLVDALRTQLINAGLITGAA